MSTVQFKPFGHWIPKDISALPAPGSDPKLRCALCGPWINASWLGALFFCLVPELLIWKTLVLSVSHWYRSKQGFSRCFKGANRIKGKTLIRKHTKTNAFAPVVENCCICSVPFYKGRGSGVTCPIGLRARLTGANRAWVVDPCPIDTRVSIRNTFKAVPHWHSQQGKGRNCQPGTLHRALGPHRFQPCWARLCRAHFQTNTKRRRRRVRRRRIPPCGVQYTTESSNYCHKNFKNVFPWNRNQASSSNWEKKLQRNLKMLKK